MKGEGTHAGVGATKAVADPRQSAATEGNYHFGKIDRAKIKTMEAAEHRGDRGAAADKWSDDNIANAYADADAEPGQRGRGDIVMSPLARTPYYRDTVSTSKDDVTRYRLLQVIGLGRALDS